MACTSIGRPTSTPLLMLSFAPLRLLILLLLLVHITVTSSLVRLTFVTHVNVVSLISVMSQFFGEASTLMFTVSGMHTVVFGLGLIFCSIISSGCLGSVTSLLCVRASLPTLGPPLSVIASITIVSPFTACEGSVTRATDFLCGSRQSCEQRSERHFISLVIGSVFLLV